jgi:hypothetical protein
LWAVFANVAPGYPLTIQIRPIDQGVGDPAPQRRFQLPRREQVAMGSVIPSHKPEERIMPVLLLWAVPAVIVIGGAGYWIVHMH